MKRARAVCQLPWLVALALCVGSSSAQEAPAPGPVLRAPPEPAPQPAIPDGTATPGLEAAAPARIVPSRARGRERSSVPEGERDRVVVRWEAEALGAVPEAGRIVVVFRLAQADGAEAMPRTSWGDIGADQSVVGGVTFALDGLEVDVASEGTWWPIRPEDLEGEFVVEALLDPLGSDAGLGDGGSPISLAVVASLDPSSSDEIELNLTSRIPAESIPEGAGIIALHLPVPASDASFPAPGELRAAVILPEDHPGDASAKVRWPVVLVMPDVGEDWRLSTSLATAVRGAIDGGILPQAIWVVIDPRTTHGYHGGVDTAVRGAYQVAITDVLLPTLAERFGACEGAPDIVAAGVGVGGWAALRLAAALPLRVSAAFAVVPMIPFKGVLGEVAFRETATEAATVRWLGAGTHHVLMTVDDDQALARVVAPDGSSGRWIDTWKPFINSADLATLIEAGWTDASESISRSWAIVPLRDEHRASDTTRQFFEWFDRRCVQEAQQGRFTPSGRGGVIPAGEVPPHQRWTVLVGVLGPEIRNYFRAGLMGQSSAIH